MTSQSNSCQSTHPTELVLLEELLSFLDFTRNYERTSGILSLSGLYLYFMTGEATNEI